MCKESTFLNVDFIFKKKDNNLYMYSCLVGSIQKNGVFMKRSFERILFVIGMGIVFLGNFLPVVNVNAAGEDEYEDEEYLEEDDEIEESNEYSDDVATYSNDEATDSEAEGTEDAVAESDMADTTEATVEEDALADLTEESSDEEEAPEEPDYKNVFGAAVYYNEPGTAQISTFMVIVWLASLAGIITFLLVKHAAGDVVSWLVGAAFGIAAIVAISSEHSCSMFAWASVGAYVILVGYIVALVGIVKNAIKTK